MVLKILKESILVETPLGKGDIIWINHGNHDTEITVALKNRAIVTFKQDQILMARSYTQKRGISHKQMNKILKVLK